MSRPHTLVSAPKKRILRMARFRLMPLTVTMLSLIFVLKINDVYFSSRALMEMVAVKDAQASGGTKKKEDTSEPSDEKDVQEDASKDTAPAEEGGHGKPSKHGESSKEAAPEDESKKVYGVGKISRAEIDALKQKQQTPYTQTEIDLLQNLSKRRDALEAQARELALKSTVLDATEKRIDTKLMEMKELQTTLARVVEDYKNQQHTEIMGLVKIYENMKPADAAAIFNELDMPILLEVIDKMSERKVAPVLAAMNPKRARDVTQELAELRRGRVAVNNAAARAAGLPATQGQP